MAVPLTSQEHSGAWYVNFRFKNMQEYAALSQVRIVSAARLYRRIGRADEMDFCGLGKASISYIVKNKNIPQLLWLRWAGHSRKFMPPIL